ncbi:hypothetical protein PMZ80_006775 [Knufia obscura]|uniref:Protein kinase domain-containing protein n=1 Tax=Knufia obscura TaxID=1635080 RepID=A0ABR0RLL6_9EURO|nr:hypothetical protein PMZ80_006775 [Knufia obscura]
MGHETICFDEGPGFIWAKTLGQGAFGSASLVFCVRDGKYYVRKEDLTTSNCDARAPNREVQNARRVADVAGTAKVQGWAHYKVNGSGKTFRVSYWDYYTAGTVVELIDRSATARVKIPEAWICVFAANMLDIVLEIHGAGIVHRDGHLNNWFITSRNENGIPKVGLGDFGISKSQEECTDKEWLENCRIDYKDVYKNIACLLEGHPYGKLHDLVRDLKEYVQSAQSTTFLHEYMKVLRDSPVLIKVKYRKRESEQKLFKESIPHPGKDALGFGVYVGPKARDQMATAFKNFVIAELQENGAFHLKGSPKEVSDKYKPVISGGWTQEGDGFIKVKR